METNQAKEAGGLLCAAWRDGQKLEALPEACRPTTVDEGYAVQDALAAAMGHPVAGYKIGATNETVQRKFGVDTPFSGRLFAPFLMQCPARVAAGAVSAFVVEPEFAFRLARDLPPRGREYSLDEVMAATEGLCPAIEVPDTRYLNWLEAGVAQLVADNAIAGLLAVSTPAAEDWRELDLSQHPVTVRIGGEVVAEGSGENVLGDPRAALTWLANALAERGEGLEAGQVVTTGSATDVVKVKPGDVVVADFGPLGSAEVSFA